MILKVDYYKYDIDKYKKCSNIKSRIGRKYTETLHKLRTLDYIEIH